MNNDDDEDDTFLIQEEKPALSKSFVNIEMNQLVLY